MNLASLDMQALPRPSFRSTRQGTSFCCGSRSRSTTSHGLQAKPTSGMWHGLRQAREVLSCYMERRRPVYDQPRGSEARRLHLHAEALQLHRASCEQGQYIPHQPTELVYLGFRFTAPFSSQVDVPDGLNSED
mmetsp:Transcript_74870/g.139761  ORF Transcript_74870/g.139761 Transcript_74870/m.139761 type:complete len:133 (+) Transcript_74870:196-594(+)